MINPSIPLVARAPMKPRVLVASFQVPVGRSSLENQRAGGNWSRNRTENKNIGGILSTLWKRRSTGKQLSLSNNTQVENKTTSHEQSEFTKLCSKTNPANPTKTESSRHRESPTQQVVRLAKYSSNFPSSNYMILVTASSLPLSSCREGKEGRKA